MVFNSASRARALSTSKMPPQQRQRLLDFVDKFRSFRAHDGDVIVSEIQCNISRARRSMKRSEMVRRRPGIIANAKAPHFLRPRLCGAPAAALHRVRGTSHF
jgi:hypothetical protein